MNEKKTTSNEFVREKIKDKPVNKKKVLTRLLLSALCGLLFAGMACLVLALVLPRLNGVQKTVQEMKTEVVSNSQQESQSTELVHTTEEELQKATTMVKDTEATLDGEKETENVVSETPVTEESVTETQRAMTIEDYQQLQNQLYAIGNKWNAAIVTVTSVVSEEDIFHNTIEEKGQNCGIIIGENEKEYLILTECANIVDASGITVSFVDNCAYEATLKQRDTNIGIAILTVPKKAMQKTTLNAIAVAQMGRATLVRNGTIVIALGNLLGSNYSILTGNVTSISGVTSAEDYNFQTFNTNMVAGNGQSGILINVDGEIIGMVMEKTDANVSQNTLTAISISDLEPIITMLCEEKSVPYIGVQVSTVTDHIAEEYGVPQGVYIREVAMDSPAMEAGLQKGDVIINVSGKDVYTDTGYAKVLRSLSPEDTISISVRRKGANGYAIVSCDVTIGVK